MDKIGSIDKKTSKDLEKFLSKVDDLQNIVNGFQSKDSEVQRESIKRADELLDKTHSNQGFNKTVINKNAYKTDCPEEQPGPVFTQPQTSQDAFLRVLEEDARRRTDARKERHQKANLIKEKANLAFKNGQFETALSLYSDAIREAKDMAPLYTNRAMAYIKLSKFQEAIDDCEFSLRVDDKWIKAYIQKGHALKCLGLYNEAISSYEEIITLDKDKEKMVQGYVDQAKEEKRVKELEKMAQKGVEENEPHAEGIAQIIKRISARHDFEHETWENMFLFYDGGFRLLTAQLTDEKSKTIFRTEGGFKMLEARPKLKDALLQKSFTCGRESDFAAATLGLFQAACQDCPQNTIALFAEPEMSRILMNLLESSEKQVKREAVLAIFEFASDNKSIELVIEMLGSKRIVMNLLNKETLELKLVNDAVLCLLRFANNKKFVGEISSDINLLVIELFQKFIDEIKHNQRKELPKCLNCLRKLAENREILKALSTNSTFWDSCLVCLDHCIHVMDLSEYRDELLPSMLNVLAMLITYKDDVTVTQAPKLASVILPLISNKNSDYVSKSLTILCRAIERSKETVKSLHSSAGLVFIKKIYKMIKSEDLELRTHALKVICFCGQVDAAMLKNVPKFDKRYNIVRGILNNSTTPVDMINQGHGALLLGYLSLLPDGMDPLMEYNEESTNVVKHLLMLCRDSPNKTTRYNCVIALGKMATNDGRILGELRRFDGINILSKHKPPVEDL